MDDLRGQHDKRFHEHLESCKQCCENPMALCPIGVMLIEAAIEEATSEITKKRE